MTGFRVLFCHGVGAVRNNPLAVNVGNWAKRNGFVFENIYYANYGNPAHPWHINDWRRDIRQRLHPSSPALLVTNSAGTQAALRASFDVPESSIVGLAAFAPAVLVTLDYMDKVRPGTIQRLRDGKEAFHPAADKELKIRVSLGNLEDFVENCVCRKHVTIPVQQPVRIVHGVRDPLVSYKGSIELLKKLESEEKSLELINCGHFINDSEIVHKTLDNLMEAVERKKSTDETVEEPKKQVMAV
ncbi:unnamed protein product [Bursaphelenchus xylophilus]|uniref:(pine wood nematode) hypothetical protein n=1 Tax=Bursaphelenchus xylophilus TaxID=6326 RepID=A0A1I7S2A0_BURXY|nr:unnamed protein product [Bursaphelenchus xylophilus]CAG9114760.1 unnamed protein product [Bursaphelenchus xylophilus]